MRYPIQLACAAVLSSLLTATLSAQADDEAVSVPCSPVADIKDAASYRVLTRDEWQAARIFFFMAKDTPATLPPGDSAMLREREDGSASIVYVDGDEACAPMHMAKAGVDILKQIRAGVISHPGGRM